MGNAKRIAGRIVAVAEPGHYVDLNVTKYGLELIATDNLREEAERFRGMAEMDAMHELLEDHTVNSEWEFVQPEDVGALTSGALLADFVATDDYGKVTAVGNMYWDSAYQVESTVEKLITTGKATWVRSQDE